MQLITVHSLFPAKIKYPLCACASAEMFLLYIHTYMSYVLWNRAIYVVIVKITKMLFFNLQQMHVFDTRTDNKSSWHASFEMHITNISELFRHFKEQNLGSLYLLILRKIFSSISKYIKNVQYVSVLNSI